MSSRKSLTTHTAAAFEAVKLGQKVPEWKLTFLRRGAYLTAAFLSIDFIGRWAVAIWASDVKIPGGIGYYTIVFAPLMVGLAVATPDAFKLVTGFVKEFKALRGKSGGSG